MKIRNINVLELNLEMFIPFKRYQEVFQKWVKDEGKWVLKDVSEVREWSTEKKGCLVDSFRLCLEQGDLLLGAFEDKELIGFVLINSQIRGAISKYVNLSMLFVTEEKRALGIGNKLFSYACEAAINLGADKLFISAYSAENTIKFYKKIGCIDAVEVISEFIDTPDDYYLEYKV